MRGLSPQGVLRLNGRELLFGEAKSIPLPSPEPRGTSVTKLVSHVLKCPCNERSLNIA